MSDLPKSVTFHEEGPREGFQMESRLYPLQDRIALVDALSETGLEQIQVASFVSPKAVPAMADADQLFAGIRKKPGVRYTSLWLNEKGFERAQQVPQVDLKGFITFYASNALSLRNNNCTAEEMKQRQAEWVKLYKRAGLPLETAYIITTFGCNLQGEIPVSLVTDIVKYIVDLVKENDLEMPRLILADTVGWANPEDVKRRIGAVRELVPDIRLGTHLHDTRGMGAANVYAALQMGVDLFESSIAGLGGCPFAAHGAAHGAGNICTEDMAHMCEELGIKTGLDLDALIEAAFVAERVFGRQMSGKLMYGGRIPRRGKAAA